MRLKLITAKIHLQTRKRSKGYMHPPRLGPTHLASVPQHTPEMKAYIQQLVQLPLYPDNISIRIKCNEIGQRIFNHYKYKNSNRSVAGGTALLDVLNSLPEYCKDSYERQRFVCSAWSNIGDDEYRWPLNE